MGCAARLVCKRIPEPHNEQSYDLFIGEVVAAYADDRVFDGGHWLFEKIPDELKTLHYVAGGRYYLDGKAVDTKRTPISGENLILIARRAELLQNLKDEIAKISPESDALVKICDLARSENVLALWDELKSYELKALINNAGFGDCGAVGERDLAKISQMLRLNVISLTLLSHLFVRDYKRKPAQLINVSSVGGYSIVPNVVTYCASKFFVSAFTEGLHRELAQDKEAKMQAKVLAPAATRTEFGPMATDDAGYDYDAAFARYHSSEEMAEFLLALYDSDACVGAVDRNSFEFSLGTPRFDYAGKR